MAEKEDIPIEILDAEIAIYYEKIPIHSVS